MGRCTRSLLKDDSLALETLGNFPKCSAADYFYTAFAGSNASLAKIDDSPCKSDSETTSDTSADKHAAWRHVGSLVAESSVLGDLLGRKSDASGSADNVWISVLEPKDDRG